MSKLQITKLDSGVRIIDLETGAYEDVPVAPAKAEDKTTGWLDEAPVIVNDQPELSGRLFYRT
jgi:hypothetical protein